MGKATTEGRDRLRESTRRVFEKRAGRRLGDEDLREMEQNLTGFFRVLGEWAKAEPKSSSVPAGEVTTDHAPQPTQPGDRTPPPGRTG